MNKVLSENIGDVLIVYHRKLKESLKTRKRLTIENGSDNHWGYSDLGDFLKIEKENAGLLAIEEALGMGNEVKAQFLESVKKQIEWEEQKG